MPVYFMLMGNTKRGIDSSYVKRMYDLKGSILKREVFAKDKLGRKIKEQFGAESHFKNTAVLKDVNLMNLAND